MKKMQTAIFIISLSVMFTACGIDRDNRSYSENEAIDDESENKVIDDEPESEDNELPDNKDVAEIINDETYEEYAQMLKEFMSGESYFFDNANAVTIDYEYPYNVENNYYFGLYDIDKNGNKELIVSQGSCQQGCAYNVFVPASTWAEGYIGEFEYIDVDNSVLVTSLYDFGEKIDYYNFRDGKLEKVDHYHTQIQSDGNTLYYHGFDDENEIEFDEYFAQEIYGWGNVPIVWYSLIESNVDIILLGKRMQNTSESWKGVYSDLVREWNIKHEFDYRCGYKLVYVDADDSPELVLIGSDEYGSEKAELYTIINDSPVLLYEATNLGENGRRVYVYERTGLFFDSSGMASCVFLDGDFLLDGVIRRDVYQYSLVPDWENPDSDIITEELVYQDKDGKIHSIKQEGKWGNNDNIFNSDLAQKAKEEFRISDFNNFQSITDNSVDYSEIQMLLGENNQREYSVNEKYARLLYQMMNDKTCGISEGMDGFGYDPNYVDLKFMLMDINGDGTDEMIITAYEMEYNLFIPADNWENAHLCNFTKYSDDGMLERDDGSSFTRSVEYIKFDGSTAEPVITYELLDDPDGTGIQYRSYDASGSETPITEEQFAGSYGLYDVHDVEGEWHIINDDNIKEYLLDK